MQSPTTDDPLTSYTPDWRTKGAAAQQAAPAPSQDPDPLSGYTPGWQQAADPLADYTPDWQAKSTYHQRLAAEQAKTPGDSFTAGLYSQLKDPVQFVIDQAKTAYAGLSQVQGTARPDPRLSKGGNSAGLTMKQIQTPYGAGAVTPQASREAVTSTLVNTALAGLHPVAKEVAPWAMRALDAILPAAPEASASVGSSAVVGLPPSPDVEVVRKAMNKKWGRGAAVTPEEQAALDAHSARRSAVDALPPAAAATLSNEEYQAWSYTRMRERFRDTPRDLTAARQVLDAAAARGDMQGAASVARRLPEPEEGQPPLSPAAEELRRFAQSTLTAPPEAAEAARQTTARTAAAASAESAVAGQPAPAPAAVEAPPSAVSQTETANPSPVTRVPSSAAEAGHETLYHETSPDNAIGMATSFQDKSGLYVSPSPDLALGQGGKGAVVEFGNTHRISVERATGKPGNDFVAGTTGQYPEYRMIGSPQAGDDVVKSVTLKPGASAAKYNIRRLRNMGWTGETLPDGSVRYSNPRFADQTAPANPAPVVAPAAAGDRRTARHTTFPPEQPLGNTIEIQNRIERINRELNQAQAEHKALIQRHALEGPGEAAEPETGDASFDFGPGAVQPHQMTRDVFNAQAWYHGAPTAAIDQMLADGHLGTSSGWLTSDPRRAAAFGGLNGREGKVAVVLGSHDPTGLLSDTDAYPPHVPDEIRDASFNGLLKGPDGLWNVHEKERRLRTSTAIPFEAAADPHRYLVEQAVARGEHVPPEVLADYPHLSAPPAPPTEPVPAGAGAGGGEPEYRYAGPGLHPRDLKTIVKGWFGALYDPIADIDGVPKWQPTHDVAMELGASREHGLRLATEGMRMVREGIDAPVVKHIENELFRDNAEGAKQGAQDAASRLRQQAQTAEGADRKELVEQAAENDAIAMRWQAHIDKISPLIPKDIVNHPDFQTYLTRYKRLIEPELERWAKTTGVDPAHLRKTTHAYVPFAAEMDQVQAALTQAPVPRRLGNRTVFSSAAMRAAGKAQAYNTDVSASLLRVASERSRKSAANRLIVEAGKTGRHLPLKGRVTLEPGEKILSYTDDARLATPTTTSKIKHRIAVPAEVADALTRVDRNLTESTLGSAGRLGKALKNALATVDLNLSVAAAPSHAKSLLSSVAHQQSGTGLAGLADMVPVVKEAETLRRILMTNWKDADVQRRYFDLSRTGALRPQDTKRNLVGMIPRVGKYLDTHHLLFSERGFDPAARLEADRKYTAENPGATPEQRRKQVVGVAGNYVAANSGVLVNLAQKAGITTFGRYGLASTTTGVKQLTGTQSGYGAARIARGLVKTAGTFAAMDALNYHNTGHHMLQNAPGHRLDIDRNKLDEQGNKRYWRGGSLMPSAYRALRTFGLNSAINGGDARQVEREIANAQMQNLGVLPRTIGTALTGWEAHIGPDGMPTRAVGPQYSARHEVLSRGVQGLVSGMGTINATFGAGLPEGKLQWGGAGWEASKPRADQIKDALGINFETTGPAGIRGEKANEIRNIKDLSAAQDETGKSIYFAPDSDAVANIMQRARSEIDQLDIPDKLKRTMEAGLKKDSAIKVRTLRKEVGGKMSEKGAKKMTTLYERGRLPYVHH